MTHMAKDLYLGFVKDTQNSTVRSKQSNWKIGKVYEATFHQRGYMEGKQTNKSMERF